MIKPSRNFAPHCRRIFFKWIRGFKSPYDGASVSGVITLALPQCTAGCFVHTCTLTHTVNKSRTILNFVILHSDFWLTKLDVYKVSVFISGLALEAVAVIVMVRRLLDIVAQDHVLALAEVAIVTGIVVRLRAARGAVPIRRGRDAPADTDLGHSWSDLRLRVHENVVSCMIAFCILINMLLALWKGSELKIKMV